MFERLKTCWLIRYIHFTGWVHKLIHKQKRTPVIIKFSHILLQEEKMAWLLWFVEQCHFCFFGCAVSLPVVAICTCRNKVIPAFGATAWFWYNVVDSQVVWFGTAILAVVVVSPDNVFTGQFNPSERYFVEPWDSNDAWMRENLPYGTNNPAVSLCYQFCFCKKKK